jgi:hypothetical protein
MIPPRFLADHGKLIWSASDINEWKDQIVFLPLC